MAHINARRRRRQDEMEWEWSHIRVLAKLFGGDLPPLSKFSHKSEPPTGHDYDRQFASLRAKGVRIKDVPPPK